MQIGSDWFPKSNLSQNVWNAADSLHEVWVQQQFIPVSGIWNMSKTKRKFSLHHLQES